MNINYVQICGRCGIQKEGKNKPKHWITCRSPDGNMCFICKDCREEFKEFWWERHKALRKSNET